MKKILLTGGTGFVGKNIVEKLKNNYNLVYFSSKQFDLRNQSVCSSLVEEVKPDIVIHAAGKVGGIGANKANPATFMFDNLVMGTNIIEASRSCNIPKFILLGTVCSYPKYTQVPFKEEDLWNGYPEETNAPYGIAKKSLMKLLEVYNQQYGFNSVNLIPVNMYGPYDHFNLTTSHVIPALILKIKKAIDNKEKNITVWGTGEASREFLYAPDFADAVELAIEKDVSPSPINIGTGREIKISKLVNTICEIMGFSGEVIYDKTKPDGQPRRCLDIEKSKKILNFQAQTDLKEGLTKTCDWFIKNFN